MLTDVAIKDLESKEKDYKVADRDGDVCPRHDQGRALISDGLPSERRPGDDLSRQIRTRRPLACPGAREGAST